jgi:DNA-binding transcriptional LysR family regulator
MISSTQWVELVAAYSQKHPEVALSCEDVKRSDLELGGLPARYNFLLAVQEDVPVALAAELEQLVIMEDHPVIMVNAQHPLAQKKTVDIRELENEVLIFPMATYPVCHYLKDMFRQAGLTFPEENSHSHLMAQQMAAKGLGIGFSSLRTVRGAGTELCYIPIQTPHKPWNLCLYRRKDPQWLPEERSFAEFAREYGSVS